MAATAAVVVVAMRKCPPKNKNKKKIQSWRDGKSASTEWREEKKMYKNEYFETKWNEMKKKRNEMKSAHRLYK